MSRRAGKSVVGQLVLQTPALIPKALKTCKRERRRQESQSGGGGRAQAQGARHELNRSLKGAASAEPTLDFLFSTTRRPKNRCRSLRTESLPLSHISCGESPRRCRTCPRPRRKATAPKHGGQGGGGGMLGLGLRFWRAPAPSQPFCRAVCELDAPRRHRGAKTRAPRLLGRPGSGRAIRCS